VAGFFGPLELLDSPGQALGVLLLLQLGDLLVQDTNLFLFLIDLGLQAVLLGDLLLQRLDSHLIRRLYLFDSVHDLREFSVGVAFLCKPWGGGQ